MQLSKKIRFVLISALAGWVLLLWPQAAAAQDAAGATPPQTTQAPPPKPPQPKNPSFEVYGFAMLDIGYDFKQIHPNWFDTMRVTKLPSFEDEFTAISNTFAGARRYRLGVPRPLRLRSAN